MHDLAVRRLSFRELRGRFNGTLVRYRSVKWRLMVYTSFDVTSMGEGRRGCDVRRWSAFSVVDREEN